MAFNISDHIQKFKERQKSAEPDIAVIIKELTHYIPEISRDNVQFQKGIIFIKNISPTKKSFLKLKKRIIIKKINTSNIIVRDII